jgi:hypothetical protein
VLNQLGFDTFHTKADRIYRVALDFHTPSYTGKVIRTGHPLADRLLQDYPEVEATTRLWNDFSLPMAVTFGNQRFMETGVMFADSNFFDVFTVKLLQGDRQTALGLTNAVVITPEMAQKYFGEDDPLGQVIRITSNESDGEYVVTGIAEPMPAKSHFHFDFLASLESVDIYWKKLWIPIVPVTYLVMAPGQQPAQFEAKLDRIVATYVAPRLTRDSSMSYEEYKRHGFRYRLFLQSLQRIHLYSNLDEIEPSGGIIQLRLLGLIGVFILLLAGINFVNLSTAYASVRAKEAGVRKTLGSHKRQLVSGFLFESICLSLIALGLALVATPVLLELMNPMLENPMLENPIALTQLFEPLFLLGAMTFSILLGLLAGVYPAFFLSNRSAVATLKGEVQGMKKSSLRNVLVVFQFAVSIILMIGALLVRQQLSHLQNKELGFERENILAVERSHATIEQLKRFKRVVLEHSGVVKTSITSRIPRRGMISTNFRPQRERMGNEINLYDTFLNHDAHKKAMTLRHALTMQTGMAWFGESHLGSMNRFQGDKIEMVLDYEMDRAPGEKWYYNSGIAVLLGGLLQNATGMSTQDFADKFLFEPMGIEERRWHSHRGIPHTGGGLHLRPRDMAKIGYLYLKDGVWAGRRLLPEGWVADATRRQVSQVAKRTEYTAAYGYMWWVLPFERHNMAATDRRDIYAAYGYMGQFIFVVPELDMIAVFTGGASRWPGELRPFDLLYDYILPSGAPTKH